MNTKAVITSDGYTAKETVNGLDIYDVFDNYKGTLDGKSLDSYMDEETDEFRMRYLEDDIQELMDFNELESMRIL